MMRRGAIGVCAIMEFALGMLIAASLGCSLGYVMGAIMRTGKEADIIQSAQFECEPKLPLAT